MFKTHAIFIDISSRFYLLHGDSRLNTIFYWPSQMKQRQKYNNLSLSFSDRKESEKRTNERCVCSSWPSLDVIRNILGIFNERLEIPDLLSNSERVFVYVPTFVTQTFFFHFGSYLFGSSLLVDRSATHALA